MTLRYDAGHEREWLVETLARWNRRGMIEDEVANRWYRRRNKLAKVLGVEVAFLQNELQDSASLIDE